MVNSSDTFMAFMASLQEIFYQQRRVNYELAGTNQLLENKTFKTETISQNIKNHLKNET